MLKLGNYLSQKVIVDHAVHSQVNQFTSAIWTARCGFNGSKGKAQTCRGRWKGHAWDKKEKWLKPAKKFSKIFQHRAYYWQQLTNYFHFGQKILCLQLATSQDRTIFTQTEQHLTTNYLQLHKKEVPLHTCMGRIPHCDHTVNIFAWKESTAFSKTFCRKNISLSV